TACRGRVIIVVRLTTDGWPLCRGRRAAPRAGSVAVSGRWDVVDWERQERGPAPGQAYTDIVYEAGEGIAKITINRPEVRNAFRPTTLFELSHAFSTARDDPETGVIILAGAGTQAFCSGGDQKIRGDDGYLDAQGVG